MSQPPSRAKRKFPIWWLLLVLGLALFIEIFPIFVNIADARHWNATPCVINGNSVEDHSYNNNDYHVDISYIYMVNGHAYASRRLAFVPVIRSREEKAAAIAGSYPRGMETICYVNPQDPKDSVLERSSLSRIIPVLSVSLALVIVGLWGAITSFRTTKRASDV
jgi:hypothetical protein